MGTHNAKIQSVIENMFATVVKALTTNDSAALISDLYVQADAESGELQVCGEEENLLEKLIIFDWVNSEEETFGKKISPVLKSTLASLNVKGLFNHSCFLRPFSVSLVDEGFNVMEELLFIDDDTFRLDDPLLKDLDDDLDSFLKGLLSDLPK
jgi:hypothetical protein